MESKEMKEQYATNPKKVCEAFYQMLQGFGYPVTREWVVDKTKYIYDGGIAIGGPDSFIKSWFDKGVA
jgi:hypothetical protein